MPSNGSEGEVTDFTRALAKLSSLDLQPTTISTTSLGFSQSGQDAINTIDLAHVNELLRLPRSDWWRTMIGWLESHDINKFRVLLGELESRGIYLDFHYINPVAPQPESNSLFFRFNKGTRVPDELITLLLNHPDTNVHMSQSLLKHMCYFGSLHALKVYLARLSGPKPSRPSVDPPANSLPADLGPQEHHQHDSDDDQRGGEGFSDGEDEEDNSYTDNEDDYSDTDDENVGQPFRFDFFNPAAELFPGEFDRKPYQLCIGDAERVEIVSIPLVKDWISYAQGHGRPLNLHHMLQHYPELRPLFESAFAEDPNLMSALGMQMLYVMRQNGIKIPTYATLDPSQRLVSVQNEKSGSNAIKWYFTAASVDLADYIRQYRFTCPSQYSYFAIHLPPSRLPQFELFDYLRHGHNISPDCYDQLVKDRIGDINKVVNQQTPLDIALTNSRFSAIAPLIEHGAKISGSHEVLDRINGNMTVIRLEAEAFRYDPECDVSVRSFHFETGMQSYTDEALARYFKYYTQLCQEAVQQSSNPAVGQPAITPEHMAQSLYQIANPANSRLMIIHGANPLYTPAAGKLNIIALASSGYKSPDVDVILLHSLCEGLCDALLMDLDYEWMRLTK